MLVFKTGGFKTRKIKTGFAENLGHTRFLLLTLLFPVFTDSLICLTWHYQPWQEVWLSRAGSLLLFFITMKYSRTLERKLNVTRLCLMIVFFCCLACLAARPVKTILSAKIPARSQKLNEYLVCRAMLSPWLACRLLLLNPFFLVWQKNLIFHIDMVANFALYKN